VDGDAVVLAGVEELLKNRTTASNATDLPDYDVVNIATLHCLQQVKEVSAVSLRTALVEIDEFDCFADFDVGVLIEPFLEVIVLVRLLLCLCAGADVVGVCLVSHSCVEVGV